MLNAANITYNDLKNLTIEEMDNIIAAVNQEKARRDRESCRVLEEDIRNILTDALKEGYKITFDNGASSIEYDCLTLIEVTR